MGEKRPEIPFYARYLLTVNEAACYFNIGAKKMRDYDQKRAVRILAGSTDSYLNKSDRLKEEI